MKQALALLPRGIALLWALLPLSGCEILNLSTEAFIELQTGRAESQSWEFISGGSISPSGTPIIAPGESYIEVNLQNYLNYDLMLNVVNQNALAQGRTLEAKSLGYNKVRIRIDGATLGDEFNFTLKMGTSDGLRNFNDFKLPMVVCNTPLWVSIPGAVDEAVKGTEIGTPPVAHWKMQAPDEHRGMQKLILEFQHENDGILTEEYDLIWDETAGEETAGDETTSDETTNDETTNDETTGIETTGAWALVGADASRNFGLRDGFYHINFPLSIRRNRLPVERHYFFRLRVRDVYGFIETASTPGFGEITEGPDTNQPIQVSFSGLPADESGVLSVPGTSGVLSWEKPLTLTITGYPAGAAFLWYIDGVPVTAGGTDASLSIPAGNFSLASHQVMVKMTLSGVVYSKSVSFRVE
ncbi:hypothetical protein [Treponema primitia]|nr:hypothetical protein [Treponema primitia]